jgi:molybdopterin adenylyltransferase
MTHEEHKKKSEGIVARCAVLTLSDTRTIETDTSGRLIRTLLERDGHAVVEHAILPDDADKLAAAIHRFCLRDDVDAVIMTGGTGLSRRDVTVPAVEKLLATPLPGFGELFRMLSWDQVGPAALLSRAVAGLTAERKLIFALPGSEKAVELAMTKLILPEIRHLIREARR